MKPRPLCTACAPRACFCNNCRRPMVPLYTSLRPLMALPILATFQTHPCISSCASKKLPICFSALLCTFCHCKFFNVYLPNQQAPCHLACLATSTTYANVMSVLPAAWHPGPAVQSPVTSLESRPACVLSLTRTWLLLFRIHVPYSRPSQTTLPIVFEPEYLASGLLFSAHVLPCAARLTV